MPLAAHGVTHPGRRATNEDAFLVDPDRGLFVVADGMGGHNAGEVASGLAVRTISDFLVGGGEPTQDLIDEALRLANDHILAVAGKQPDYSGMGTTVVAVLLTDGQAIFGHVGDSRIYHWHAGALTPLTRDDSWVAAALHESSEGPRELEQHPMRHVLTKVVGLRPDLQPTVSACEFVLGDVLVLCSDGVHGSVPDATLSRLLASTHPVAEIAESVVRAAITGGATDNLTAVVVRRE